ncbi:16S rRNA (guanine(527)-N(7))-methyltransferase RsmG [Lacticaseibacillus thailandensis]|uniref:Ribosomal RNA small subunit methyltransferase G n=1 Tax=Lacticaseibacillus thailandensis DSM 22698 = JCM 13996 TaxID=1423810 RepID=A0A0R2C778_9LACO|nr:16S rRNA (guanine(527)-N(7))-methyltransferase RsmG [Lacticaseibacillus thailandensis]KRM87077.1 16S rRNA methyltransferase GidB [Lacticaseibacillus thailandensis DSM 22698 = JCM 13996]
MNPEEFAAALARFDVVLSAEQQAQFAEYYSYLVAENQKMNLTAITAEGDVYLKHFYDSVTPLLEFPELWTTTVTLCDVGAGAGFPSLPMKILNPHLEVTIVDSLQKRIDFLERLCQRLHLDGVHLVHARAEEFGRKQSPDRESFGLVTARAVAALDVLAELCLPLVQLGGKFIAMKGAQGANELAQADKAIKILGGHVVADRALTLPVEEAPRHLVVIDKVVRTPKKYPRKPGTPAKQPIGGQ